MRKTKQRASDRLLGMNLAVLHHLSLLLLVCFQGSTALVEPPINVILHCRNLRNIVEWSYDEALSGLRFRVFIGSISSPPTVHWVEPPTLQADVSNLSDPKNDYRITVKAVNGQNESSEAAPPGGITFSYFMDSPAKQKCILDFPAVNATTLQGGYVQFSFTHPGLLYQYKLMKPRKKKSRDEHITTELSEFSYHVAIVNQTGQMFTCSQNVCDGRISVDPAQGKHCLRVTEGEMDKIKIEATQDYCAEPLLPKEPSDYTILYAAIGLLVFAAVILVFAVFIKKKIAPSSSTNVPSAWKHWTLGVTHDPILRPEEEPTSPTPLLITSKEKEEREVGETPPDVTSDTEYEFRGQIGVSNENEVGDDAQVENGEGSGYMHGRSFGEDEDEAESSGDVSSGYEKRQVINVNIAPGEQAEGYRGTEPN